MSNNVETMFSVREKPWHGLGTIVQEAVTSEEAIKLAGLDWTVRQEPVAWNGQDSGWRMNVRDSDERVLGVVGGRYQIVQNTEAFDFVDNLLGEGVTFETAGSLANGRRIWLLAKMPSYDILGDVVDPYMVFTNNHDSCGSLKVAMTPTRVVCSNTLALALQKASRTWVARHTGSIGSKLEEARKTFALAGKYMDSISLEAENLAAIKIAPKDFTSFSEKLFPITGEMGARKEESQIQLRGQLESAYNEEDLANIRGTGWGVINAVADMVSHKTPSRKTDNYQENQFMALIDGTEVIMNQAYNIIRTF